MTTVQPVNQRASCAAFPVDEMSFDGPVPAGAFEFYLRHGDAQDAPPKGLLFGCPCGCGEMKTLRFHPWLSNGPGWNWDGNREKPTLTPSINILQFDTAGNQIGEHWHGFLTAGEFRSC